MKFTIFGSSVTRDAFASESRDDSLHDYFARCSVVSAVAEPLGIDEEKYDGEKIFFEHNFHKNAVFRDLNKPFRLKEWIHGTDYLIIDLVDERFAVKEAELENGKKSYITYSNIFLDSRMEESLSLRSVTLAEKNKLYKKAALEFSRLIAPLLKKGRVILHEAYFAPEYIDGDEIKSFEGTGFYAPGYIDKNNENLKFCYDALKEACKNKLKVVCLKDTGVNMGDTKHRWGKGAVHYVSDYYKKLFEEIDKICLEAGTENAGKKIYPPLISEGMESRIDFPCFAEKIAGGENLIVLDEFTDTVPFDTDDIDNLDWHMQVTRSPNSYLLHLHGQKPVYYLTGAYLETGEKKYLELAEKFIRSWFKYDKETENKVPLAWNDHCVALRAENIVYFVSAVECCDTGADTGIGTDWLYPEIRRHAEWLGDDKNYCFNHNHGIFEDISLYNAGMFLSEKQYCGKAAERLKGQLKFAYPFKVHIENSMGYNLGMMTILEMLQKVFETGEYGGINKIIKNILKNAVKFLVCAYRPDLSLPAYGDTLGKLREGRGDADTWNLPELEYICSKGETGRKPKNKFVLFKEDGFAFARSSYDKEYFEESTWLMFRSGFNGMTHKHRDELSLVWWSKGANILIDPGMYNYMVGNALCDYMNGVFAHSAVAVDGKNYPIGEAAHSRAGMFDVSLENGRRRFRAYNDLYYGVRIDRSVIYIDENTLLVIDDIISDEVHEYAQIFHLSESVSVRSCQNRETIAKISDGGWNLSIRQLAEPDSLKLKLISGQNPVNGDISVRSIGMNEVLPTTSVLYVAAGSNHKFVTVLQLFEDKADLYEAGADGDYAYCNKMKFSLESRERLTGADICMDINGETLTVCNKGRRGEAEISLMNQKTGRQITDTQIINESNNFTCGFGQLLPIEAAVKCLYRADDQTIEEITGFIDRTDGKFVTRQKEAGERRPFVIDHVYSRNGNDNSYVFKLRTTGFNQLKTKWYVYKNGASFDFVNGGEEFEYEFVQPGKYCIFFKAYDIYLGEIEKGSFPEIEIYCTTA